MRIASIVWLSGITRMPSDPMNDFAEAIADPQSGRASSDPADEDLPEERPTNTGEQRTAGYILWLRFVRLHPRCAG